MTIYQLITYRQWLDLQQEAPPSLLAQHRGFFEHKKPRLEASGFKVVKYQYSCQNLYQTLETLGLYYGRNSYNHDDIKFSAALKTALTSNKAILISKEIDLNSGMLPPQTNFLKLLNHKIPRKLTPAEISARELAYYGNEENWIKISIKDLPNQPFTLFDTASQKRDCS